MGGQGKHSMLSGWTWTYRVVAGSREALAVPSVKLSGVNWLSTPFDCDGVECGKNPLDDGPGTGTAYENGGRPPGSDICRPQYGVSPGQLASRADMTRLGGVRRSGIDDAGRDAVTTHLCGMDKHAPTRIWLVRSDQW